MLTTTRIPQHRTLPLRQLNIATQDTRVAHARVMANASVWSMDTDTDVDIDTFALIIAVSEHARPGVPFNTWTRAGLFEVLDAVPAYCRAENTFVPVDIAEQLSLFITFLSETGWLGEHGEGIEILADVFVTKTTTVQQSARSFDTQLVSSS
jgi:hypothetical protein